MSNERDNPPEASPSEGDEESKECDQEASTTVGNRIGCPYDPSLRPVDPKSEMNVVV